MTTIKIYLAAFLASMTLIHSTTNSQPVSFSSVDDFAYPTGAEPPYYIDTSDFNADGFMDIWVSLSGNDSMAVLLNDGTGGLNEPLLSYSGENPKRFVLEDFNEDGISDVIIFEWDYHFYFAAGTGDGYFAAPISASSAWIDADQMVPADFNSDGHIDFVSSQNNDFNDTIYMHFGNGDGTFDSPQSIYINNPHGLAAGDFNNDSFTDITIHSNISLLVLLNNGTGNFTQTTIAGFSTDNFSLLIVSDLNNDGVDDIATLSNYITTNQLKTVLSNGDGTFQPALTMDLPFQVDYTDGVAVNLLQSGNSDLVLTCQRNFVQVLEGNGDGTFNTGSKYPAGGYPINMIAADFNSDGYPDVATANLYANNVAVLNGQADGSLDAYPYHYFIGNFLSSISANDFNEDGFLDLSATLSNVYQPDFIAVLTGDGAAGFSTDSILYETAGNLVSGEFTSDNHQDLLVIAEGIDFNVYPGLGNGQFDSPISSAGNIGHLTTADINNDARADIIVTATDSLKVYSGIGDGTFLSSWAVTSTCATSHATGDFNSDGNPDLVLGTAEDYGCPGYLIQFRGDGTGAFFNPDTIMDNVNISGITTGDFNGDSHTDIALSSVVYKLIIFLNDGAGNFPNSSTVALTAPGDGITQGDLNNDGFIDLVIFSSYISDRVMVLIGDGTGGFTLTGSYTVGATPFSIAIGDFNEDGWEDIATGNYEDGSITLLLNTTGFATAVVENHHSNQELLMSIAPNPFSDLATIGFSLETSEHVTLELTDLWGRKIKTIAKGNFQTGHHEISMEKEDLSDGIYLLQMKTVHGLITQKIVIQ